MTHLKLSTCIAQTDILDCIILCTMATCFGHSLLQQVQTLYVILLRIKRGTDRLTETDTLRCPVVSIHGLLFADNIENALHHLHNSVIFPLSPLLNLIVQLDCLTDFLSSSCHLSSPTFTFRCLILSIFSVSPFILMSSAFVSAAFISPYLFVWPRCEPVQRMQ